MTKYALMGFLFFNFAYAEDRETKDSASLEFVRQNCNAEWKGEESCGQLMLDLFDKDQSGLLETSEAIESLKALGIIMSESSNRDQRLIAVWLYSLAGGNPPNSMQPIVTMEMETWRNYFFGYRSVGANAWRLQESISELVPYLKLSIVGQWLNP